MRNQRLDVLRGLTMVSMIAYHTLWDIHFIFGMPLGWYVGLPGYVWQQSICWTFILLSGYLAGMGQHQDRQGGRRDPGEETNSRQRGKFPWRGLQVFGCGALITVVTILVMPQDRVIFGVLTLLGSCKLIVWALHRFSGPHKKTAQISYSTSPVSSPTSPIPLIYPMSPYLGMAVSFAAFTAFRHTEQGWLGIPADPRLWFAPSLPVSARGLLIRLPEAFFCSNLTAYLGFPQPDFFSTDYFPLLPWFFLFMTGYFLYRCVAGKASGPARERGNRIRQSSGPAGKRGNRIRQAAGPPMERGNRNRQSADRERNSVQDTGLVGWLLMKTGRHSLLIYMFHQPIIYGILLLVFRLFP